MRKLSLYKIVALATLLSLLLGACRCGTRPVPVPTLPPYTPPPPGTALGINMTSDSYGYWSHLANNPVNPLALPLLV